MTHILNIKPICTMKNNMEDIGYLPYYNYFQEHKKEILDKYKAIKGALPVLAILDGDYDPFDKDLTDRIWRNAGEEYEKAYNGKDDDGNGWVDDYSIMNFIDKKFIQLVAAEVL